MGDREVKTGVEGRSWVEIFTSNWILARFLFGLVFVVVVSGVTLYEVISLLRPTLAVNSQEGTITLSGFGQPDRALLLLPASQFWVDTGIDVSAKQQVRVSCGGNVHLAVHRLVESAKTPTEPLHHVWGGPDGNPSEDRPIDVSRRKMLVEPNVKIGAVIAFIKAPSDAAPGPSNPRPHGIQVVGRQNYIRGTGRLYLTVNDLVFEDTPENGQAFIGNQDIVDASYGKGIRSVDELSKEWEGLRKNQRTLAFYDDNIGDFLVQVAFESK
jgi:hypothetical protein